MLKPRKRPKSPPREETNSTGPIEMPLSNSCGNSIISFLFWINKFMKVSPMTVSCPKKMLRVAKSSSQALYVVGPVCGSVNFYFRSFSPEIFVFFSPEIASRSGCQSGGSSWGWRCSWCSLGGWSCLPCCRHPQPGTVGGRLVNEEKGWVREPEKWPKTERPWITCSSQSLGEVPVSRVHSGSRLRLRESHDLNISQMILNTTTIARSRKIHEFVENIPPKWARGQSILVFRRLTVWKAITRVAAHIGHYFTEAGCLGRAVKLTADKYFGIIGTCMASLQ